MIITRKLTITVPGLPIPKGRVRYVRATGRKYTPEKTRSYENLVRLVFNQKYPNWAPINSPIDVVIRAYFPIAESWSKKKKAQALNGEYLKQDKPDVDNIGKSICDGLNKVAWTDDARIHSLFISKDYSDTPRADVSIYFTEKKEEEENHG